MTATETRCPHCQARFRVPADQLGKPAKCGRCRQTFTPAAPPPPAPAPAPAPPQRVAAALAPPPPAPKPVLRPVAAAAAVPRPADRDDRDRDGEDEPDDRPRKKSRGEKPARRGLHPGVIAGIVAGAAVLLFGLVGLVVYLATRDTPGPAVAATGPTTPAVTAPNTPTSPSASRPATPVPVGPTEPAPAASGGSDAAADAVRRVKAATVYIRCSYPGKLGMGSGFFAGQPGYIVTNSHVVGFEPGHVDLPHRVEVVVDSGETTERRFDARLVALNAEDDLALLWVNGQDLPKPLRFGRSADLIETQDVFIFGYPLGEKLGLNISVNKSTVSSLRKDKTGAIEVVQVAGGMHPGNSGGPVTDKSGAVIGVSVAGILGTQINFAIPAEVTDKFVREQIASGGNLKGGKFPTAPPRRRGR
jgi:putative serine protease PepD